MRVGEVGASGICELEAGVRLTQHSQRTHAAHFLTILAEEKEDAPLSNSKRPVASTTSHFATEFKCAFTLTATSSPPLPSS